MRAKSTAEKIISAAGKILDREGADAVTMRRVATAVGITPMALYRHFADREGLLNALSDEGFQKLAGRVAQVTTTGKPDWQLRKIVDMFLDFALEKPHLFDLMFLKPREGARQFPRDFRAGKSPTANLTAAALQAGMDQGIFRRDDVWEITFETGALLQGLVMLYAGGRVGASEQQFRELCHRAIGRYLNGIRT